LLYNTKECCHKKWRNDLTAELFFKIILPENYSVQQLSPHFIVGREPLTVEALLPFRHANSPLFEQTSFWRLLLHLPRTIKLLWRLLKDRRVPFFGKFMFALALAYVVWPIDLIPDFVFPVIGQIDDVAVLLAGVRFFLRSTPPQIMEEHLAQLK